MQVCMGEEVSEAKAMPRPEKASCTKYEREKVDFAKTVYLHVLCKFQWMIFFVLSSQDTYSQSDLTEPPFNTVSFSLLYVIIYNSTKKKVIFSLIGIKKCNVRQYSFTCFSVTGYAPEFTFYRHPDTKYMYK